MGVKDFNERLSWMECRYRELESVSMSKRKADLSEYVPVAGYVPKDPGSRFRHHCLYAMHCLLQQSSNFDVENATT